MFKVISDIMADLHDLWNTIVIAIFMLCKENDVYYDVYHMQS